MDWHDCVAHLCKIQSMFIGVRSFKGSATQAKLTLQMSAEWTESFLLKVLDMIVEHDDKKTFSFYPFGWYISWDWK